YEQALPHYTRALALMEKARGPEHPDVAISLNNLGNVSRDMGRHEQALRYHTRALAVREKALGPEHAKVAMSIHNLGTVLYAQGRYELALRRFEHARAVWEKALEPGHPHLASVYQYLGRVYVKLQEWDKAEHLLEQARAVAEKSLRGARSSELAGALLGLGELRLAQGRPAAAVPLLEQALTLAMAGKAEVRFLLAQSLWGSGGDKRRAVALATEARAEWQRLGHPTLAQASQWLTRAL
ncbi:MAG TPA: tetratricopeptide repeat protein, partial [Myxococcaceae bacterium]|nr:tetratricopeptide repeat protein [Myxococcaceae bacterium]